MPLKVTWKKGMRLSTEVFDALDASHDESVRLSNLISTGGRSGLIPFPKPFELSVNVSNNVLEVVSLSCHGVTKSGKLVDIDFDSNYTNTFDARVAIPNTGNEEALLLIVKLHDKRWREINEMYSEQSYSFDLIGENSPVDSDSLPIACLVNQYGWRLDETDFVPPCLYTGAHFKFTELVARTELVLKSIADLCLDARNCVAVHLLGILWPEVVRALIDINKSQERLSPAGLFAVVQKVISAFMIGCSIDEHITLENAEPFIAYHQKPYDGKNIYRDIRKGVDLCSEIRIKMDAVCSMTEVREIPAPPVEKHEPQPVPAGRHRWEGIEI